MKFKLLLLALVVAAPLQAAGEYLLKATAMKNDGQRWVATDGATLISKNSETRISADQIVFDQSAGTFKFSGHVVIQAAGAVVETSEATLKTEGQKVYFLSKGEISLLGAHPLDPKLPGQVLPAFGEPFPKTETKLTAPR